METTVQPVSEKDLHTSLSIPAIYCNRFVITVGSTVRISFAEQDPRIIDVGPIFRTAICMTHTDAIELAQVLSQLMKPIELQLDAAAQRLTEKGLSDFSGL